MKQYRLKQPPSSGATIFDDDSVLNEQQRAVVRAGTGPLLVIAGAGSGKTHTLTYRMAYLIHKGIAPERILLLTFTNRAAKEMTTRAAKLLPLDVKRLWSGTFHSIANRILRREAHRLGYPSDYTILDSEDAATLMKSCLAEIPGLNTKRRFPNAKTLLNIHSFCINTEQCLDAVLASRYPYMAEDSQDIGHVLDYYQRRKKAMGVMDYDDLLLNWHRLLVEHDDARALYSAQFEHILVDEYQDTNHIQGRIIDLMASHHGNLMVVGDDCQSIYAFRGADYTNILGFPERFPNCRQFRLETNYRSIPEILHLANASIHLNKKQFHKTLHTHRPAGQKPIFIRLQDVNQQAQFVCQRILELLDEGFELDDIAVLYRSHYHSMQLQVEMTRHNIPYMVRSGLRFFEQAHIKDILAYLRVVFNPRDELAFMRLIRQWPGIGNKRARGLWAWFSAHTDPFAALGKASPDIKLTARARTSWEQVTNLLQKLAETRLNGPPDAVIEQILASPYQDYVQQHYEDFDSRLTDIQQLAIYSGQFESLDRFLGEVSLLSGITGQEVVVGDYTEDKYVCLTSIHQSKGLEWKACFVLCLSEGDFPSKNAATLDEIEEERRLFYVATTRAKDELYLCHPMMRTGRDYFTLITQESQFIRELMPVDHSPEQTLWEEWCIAADGD